MRRTSYILRAVCVFYLIGVCTESVLACTCSGSYGLNAWDIAHREEQGATAIFEGTPARFELQWKLLSAKEGALIPAGDFGNPDGWASMVITFRVQRSYRGDLGAEVRLRTGLGGGDCGAQYLAGFSYLVYAYGGPDRLGVSMCSPGGWIDGGEVAANLRYLRHQRPTPGDLKPITRWGDPGYADERKRRDLEERYAAATGKICGKMIGRIQGSESLRWVSFLSTQGYSPFWRDYSVLEKDDSFCSPILAPGKYYLYFGGDWSSSSAAQYYPGVNTIEQAQAIEIGAGQTKSDIELHLREESSYSVHGFLFTDQKPDFKGVIPQDGVTVMLVRSDGDQHVWYRTTAKFFVARAGYFSFENVVPGHYLAYVMAPGTGWMMRKKSFDVTSHMKFISLDLVHGPSK
jgi:hypothetical protein